MYQRYRVSFFHRPFLVPETVASLRTYPGGHGGQHYQNQEPLFHLGENRYLCERRTFAGQAVPCALPAGLPLSPVCIIFAADKSGGGSELSSVRSLHGHCKCNYLSDKRITQNGYYIGKRIVGAEPDDGYGRKYRRDDGVGRPRGFATPSMVALMEHAAMTAVAAALPEGSSTVGAEMNVTHIKPSGLGAEITATAVLTGVEGRKLTFNVGARDAEGMIGEGVHVRYVVDREKFMAKVR